MEIVTIAPKLVEPVETKADPENWKQISTYIEDKEMEVTGHTDTQSKPKCHVNVGRS